METPSDHERGCEERGPLPRRERAGQGPDEAQGFSVDGTWDFLCECHRLDCLARISLRPEEYELIRGSPVQFAVAPGHVVPEVERVVHESNRFFVVEKHPGVQPIARATDPRA